MSRTEGWQPEFVEEQALTQPWVYALAVAMALRELSNLVGKRRSRGRMRWLRWGRWLVLGVLVPFSLTQSRLITEASPGRLRVRFVGPVKAEWTHSTDQDGAIEAEPVTYHPWRDYGGWGLRWTPRRGLAVTVQGDRGVRIRTAKGRSVLLGSTRPEELADTLRRST